MANVTYVELQERVARKLGILPAGQSVGADDGALIGAALVDLQEQLSHLQIVFLDVQDGVESIYADALAQMGAAALVDEFELPEPKRSQLLAAGALGVPGRSLAERRLRELAGVPTTKLSTAHDVTVV